MYPLKHSAAIGATMEKLAPPCGHAPESGARRRTKSVGQAVTNLPECFLSDNQSPKNQIAMEKAKTVKIKVKKSQLRVFCSFFMKMQRKMVYDMEQGRWVLDTNGTTSVEPEFYQTLCEVSELLSAKVAEHGHAPAML